MLQQIKHCLLSIWTCVAALFQNKDDDSESDALHTCQSQEQLLHELINDSELGQMATANNTYQYPWMRLMVAFAAPRTTKLCRMCENVFPIG